MDLDGLNAAEGIFRIYPDLWESGWKKNRTHHLAIWLYFQMVCNNRILSCLKIRTGANQISFRLDDPGLNWRQLGGSGTVLLLQDRTAHLSCAVYGLRQLSEF